MFSWDYIKYCAKYPGYYENSKWPHGLIYGYRLFAETFATIKSILSFRLFCRNGRNCKMNAVTSACSRCHRDLSEE